MNEKEELRHSGTEVAELETQDVWVEIFTGLDKLRILGNTQATNMAPLVSFMLPDEQINRSMLINIAAITKDGKPRIIVINADLQSKPSQQVVLEAEWNDETPKIVVNDFSARPDTTQALDHETLGDIAAEVVIRLLENAENEKDEDSRYFIPDSYATGVN